MREVYIISDNIVSPLGVNTTENFTALKNGFSGIKQHHNTAISPVPFFASLFDEDQHFLHSAPDHAYTRFEQLMVSSISDAVFESGIDVTGKDCIFILSSTKGNINLIEDGPPGEAVMERLTLSASARLIAEHFKLAHTPLVVSNACISGILALITGMRLIQSGQFEHAVVCGADIISRFVLSGFQSFQAISDGRCKPFDAARLGINLGEGAGTMVLSSSGKGTGTIRLSAGSVSNDANHISGPSRTGEELYQAIKKSMHGAGVDASDIDFISAHGTATIYNDEMEAKAINLADMQEVPVNSLKGYFGHTLGAAGLIESIMSCQSLRENLILPTLGFENPGVSKPLNICHTLQTGNLINCLKTASGFGGCNASLVLSKQ
jgi:3-oxoacyl-[acyl-carrier-protein] synthase-1